MRSLSRSSRLVADARCSDPSLYYEEQKDVSLRRAPYLLQLRIPKFFGTFAAQVAASGNGWLHASGVSAADLVLFHVRRHVCVCTCGS